MWTSYDAHQYRPAARPKLIGRFTETRSRRTVESKYLLSTPAALLGVLVPDTRSRILTEAMRLFGELGYTATTISKIEEAAGLTGIRGAVQALPQ